MSLLMLALGCTPPAETTTPTGDTGPTGSDTDTLVTDTDTAEPQGQCGDVTTWDVVLRGRVHNPFDQPIAGATITLEDRGWMPITVLATGTSDTYGAFELSIQGLTSVEDCWGILLDYVVTGESQLGQVGEDGVNPELFDAVNSGSLEATMGLPLVLDYPED
jgi:hypothetical protein